MRVGGRASRGSAYRAAGARLLPVAWLSALLLALPFAALVAAPVVEAQGVARWYGPSDPAKPSEGWAFRAPVVVINDNDSPVDNAVVAVEMDFGKLLVAAGWINESRGSRVQPRSFTLDPASIRVVEYERGFRDFKNAVARETPHLFYPALFESSAKGLEFNATTNPAGTVLWVLKDRTLANDRRYYYVYFNAREYGSVPAPQFTENDQGPLAAYPYAGRGTTFYWYENGATGNTNRIDVYAPFEDTTVAIYREELLGQYRLAKISGLPRGQGGEYRANPDTFGNATNGPYFSYALPQNAHYKLVASKPVQVTGHGNVQPGNAGPNGAQFGSGAFALSVEGSYAGRSFRIPAYSGTLMVYASDPTVSTSVQIREIGDPGADESTASVQSSATLSASRPTFVYTDNGVENTGQYNTYFVDVRSGKPVLVQYLPMPGYRGQNHAIPARSGALTGTSFGMQGVNEDLVRVRALEETLVSISDPLDTSVQVYPLGDATTPPATLAPGCDARVKERAGLDLDVNATWNGLTVDVVSEKAHLAMETGGRRDAPNVGFFGGLGGQRVLATGPLSVVAHFNETRLTIKECTSKGETTRPVTLARDGRVTLEGPGPRAGGATSQARYEILSNKPVSAFSIENTDHYARFIPGRPVSPTYELGALEFRGHLVDLRSPERPGLIVPKTTGPTKPVEFKLTAFNLGQWIGGANLPDTITITCASDRLWDIKGCGDEDETKQIALPSRSSQTFVLTITPKNAPPNDQAKIVVTATSETTGVKASITLFVTVEISYDVGMWFDFVGGLEAIKPPRSVDRGEAALYRIVIKNLGSVRDTYDLEKSEDANARGWTSRLVRTLADEAEVTRVTLNADATETLLLEVQSPGTDAGEDVQNFFETLVKATSIQSAATSDVVTAATRIRADIQFALAVDEATKLGVPGKPTPFNVSLENRGNDIARIALSREGVLPERWDAIIVDSKGTLFTDIDLPPAAKLNVTLLVTPPPAARAGDLATVRLGARTTVGDETRATEESATVIVRQVHNVTLPEPAEIVALPGDEIRYALDLTNVGNGDEVVELIRSSVRVSDEAGAAFPAWPLRGTAGDEIPLLRDDAGILEVAVTVPDAMPANLYNVNFTLRLSREGAMNVTLPVNVRQVRQHALDVPADIRVSPGQEFAFPVDVRNTGNVQDVATLAATLPSGWAFRFEPPTTFLAPGATERVTLVVNASRDAREGDTPFDLSAVFSNGGAPSVAPTLVTVGRPDLVLGEPLTQGTTRRGDVLVVSVPVGNRGAMDAADVRVALVVNGEAVDTVTLARIPAGAERLATLKWQVERGVETVELVVNPDGRVVEASDEGGTVAVNFATSAGIPAPALPLVLLALAPAALLLLLRRRRSA